MNFYIEDCSHYISHANDFYSHYKYLTCNTIKLSTFERNRKSNSLINNKTIFAIIDEQVNVVFRTFL